MEYRSNIAGNIRLSKGKRIVNVPYIGSKPFQNHHHHPLRIHVGDDNFETISDTVMGDMGSAYTCLAYTYTDMFVMF